MNKKYTVKNDYDRCSYFVLSAETNLQEQLEQVFSIRKGYGFSLEYDEKTIRIIDYFHGETRASFEIVNIEETNDEICYTQQQL